MLRSRVQSLKVKEKEEVVLQVENLTLTNNPLTIISFFLMTAPVPVPAAAALPSEPCFSACHCFRPVSRYDCTRLRVFASCTREMLVNTPALMTGIHAWGIPRGSWNRGFTCTAQPAQLRPMQHTPHLAAMPLELLQNDTEVSEAGEGPHHQLQSAHHVA